MPSGGKGSLSPSRKRRWGWPKGIDTSAVPKENRTPTLADAGIDKKLSSRAKKMAAVPEAEFEGDLPPR